MNSCARCGAELRVQTAEGFCVRCLLESGLDPARKGGGIIPQLASSSDALSSPTTVRYFGDYELMEELGRGGMGVVYRARQASLNRFVAVKMLLHGEFSDEAFVWRFKTEAEAAAQLDHPNIVPIYEIGEHEGLHYFSMKLIGGGNLAQEMTRESFSVERAAKLVGTITRAVHYAHQRGVLHRDLKPHNILLDEEGQPHLTDFGLAKILERDTGLTVSETVLGSPAYMAPEQAAGKTKHLTTSADIYSLGAILYALVTGRPPFQAGTAVGTLRQVIENEPVKPRQINKSIDLDLETICLKCLEKEPQQRYGSAQSLADDLERWQAGEPIRARPLGEMEKLWRWGRRNPGIATLSAAVILLVVTLALGSTLASMRIKRAERNTIEKLYDSYLATARAVRGNRREGQRFESLETVAKAATIHSSLELRNEAIACLATTDVRFRDHHESPGYDHEYWDPQLERRAYIENGGRLRVLAVRDNTESFFASNLGGVQWIHALSPGGRYIALTRLDGRNAVWDIDKSEERVTNILQLVSAVFSADGQMVFASCQDGQLRRFALDPVHELPSLPIKRAYHLIRPSPQAGWLAGYEEGGKDLEVRDVRDGSLLSTLSQPSRVGSFAWSSDGVDLAVGCYDGRIFIWNALTGEKKQELRAHQHAVTSVGLSHSGWLLGSSGWDGQFKLWELAPERLLLAAAGASYQICFSADDCRLGYLQRGHETGLLEVTGGPIFRRLNCRASPNGGSLSIDVSPDGRLLAATFAEGVRIWADQRTENPFFLPTPDCYSAIFAPDGTNLITSGLNGVALWPMHSISGETVDELHIGPRQTIQDGIQFNYAALSVDGRWVAGANPAAQAVSVYEVHHPSNRFGLGSQPSPQFVSISPDGHWVAGGNFKGSGVKVWEFESKMLICDLPTGSSTWGTFSPNNRWLATSGTNIDLWETGSWKHKYSIGRTQNEASTSLAFSPDGGTMAILDRPAIIRLVAVDTGEVLANLEAPDSANIWYLRFSPDSSQLFALEWNQQVQVWDLRRLQAELRKLNLDWNGPPFPGEPSAGATKKPIHIVLEESARHDLTIHHK
jgi:WD40 repeat protein